MFHVGERAKGTPAPAYRWLLLPKGAVWVDAQGWRLDVLRDLPDNDLVWGETKVDRSVPPVAALRRSLSREAVIAALRLGADRRRRTVRVRRLALSGGHGSLREQLGNRVRRGTLIELATDHTGERPLDHVLASAAVRAVGRPIVGAGGCLIQRVITVDETVGILRVGLLGDASDPTIASEALARLAAFPEVGAPHLLGRGSTGAATWSLETAIPGRSGSEPPQQVWSTVIRAWGRLPRSGDAPRATSHDLQRIAGSLPQHAAQLAALAEAVEEAVADVRGILAHRDLWPGNVLIDRRRYSGVIDWGSWRTDGLPGSDLLQLYVGGQRRRSHESLGDAWLRRPWLEPRFQSLMGPYWTAVEIEPNHRRLEAISIAWWANEVAGTLERIPQRGRDRNWLTENVEAVLAATGTR